MEDVSPKGTLCLRARYDDLPKPFRPNFYYLAVGFLLLLGSYGVGRRFPRAGVVLRTSTLLGLLALVFFQYFLYRKKVDDYFAPTISWCDERHAAKCLEIQQQLGIGSVYKNEMLCTQDLWLLEPDTDQDVLHFLAQFTGWDERLGNSYVGLKLREVYRYAHMVHYGTAVLVDPSRPPPYLRCYLERLENGEVRLVRTEGRLIDDQDVSFIYEDEVNLSI